MCPRAGRTMVGGTWLVLLVMMLAFPLSATAQNRVTNQATELVELSVDNSVQIKAGSQICSDAPARGQGSRAYAPTPFSLNETTLSKLYELSGVLALPITLEQPDYGL